jgi:sulfoxide reductase heme-binding subunit YedZ
VSVTYRTVAWNPQKRRYDLVAATAILTCLGVFVATEAIIRPELTVETLLIRSLGATAFVVLNVILCIGPLARLDRRFLPLLYNRRHLGVMMFTLALAHGVFSIVQFHSAGTLNPLVSVLVSNPRYTSISQLPFQPFGLLALVMLFLMAATSHDFWLRNLTAPVWKALHMGVYVAYTSIVVHVVFGVLQGETGAALGWLLGAAVLVVFILHIVAGRQEAIGDRPAAASELRSEGFVDICDVDDIPEHRAIVRCLSGERVAIFRYDGVVSALSNVCQHQNGPLGEGRIVNGCVVCPWHGYEYLPDSGASPPPFTEKVPTFEVRVHAGRVLVHPQPLPPGTRVEPARIMNHKKPNHKEHKEHEEEQKPFVPFVPFVVRRSQATKHDPK